MSKKMKCIDGVKLVQKEQKKCPPRCPTGPTGPAAEHDQFACGRLLADPESGRLIIITPENIIALREGCAGPGARSWIITTGVITEEQALGGINLFGQALIGTSTTGFTPVVIGSNPMPVPGMPGFVNLELEIAILGDGGVFLDPLLGFPDASVRITFSILRCGMGFIEATPGPVCV